MVIYRLIIFVCCIGFLVNTASCDQQGTQELGFGGYWYVLPVPKTEFKRVGNHGLVWNCNGWKLLVDENEFIYLNDVKYGQMTKGDELTVTWEGKVLLNDKEIFPIKDEDSDE